VSDYRNLKDLTRAVEDAEMEADDMQRRLRFALRLNALMRAGLTATTVLFVAAMLVGIVVAWTKWSALLGFLAGGSAVVGVGSLIAFKTTSYDSAVGKYIPRHDIPRAQRRVVKAERDLNDARERLSLAVTR
jgi:hypothetical protein